MDQPTYHASKLPAAHNDAYPSASNSNRDRYPDLYRHRDLHPYFNAYRYSYRNPNFYALKRKQSEVCLVYCKKYPCSIMKLEVWLTLCAILPTHHFDQNFMEVTICLFENSRGEPCSSC